MLTRPPGSSSTTTMNRAPIRNSHSSGAARVAQLLSALTETAPRIGPSSVPRPPTATQTTASSDLSGVISLGLMMPICAT
ncbi:MAG: hypothetical protein BWX86_02652 [Verrucomicrobia bacterium ADurb.Bin122]|nr:MAG: hypothetical protein BWX86_02652 [Verrucomicrobia bacterium ADurb.Bin122]